MRRKLFTFLVAFLATLSGAVWAEENPSGTSESAPYDLATRGELTITDNGIYWVTSSLQTNNGITINGGALVTNHKTPTIYLDGIDIKVSGQAINISGFADPTFVILGENKITSSGRSGILNEPAINIARVSTLTVSGKSTGILDINMTGSEEQNQVAIGNAGNNLDPFYDCGSFTVEGGTIKTNGYFGEFDIHGFRLKENAVIIVKDIAGFDSNTDLGKGGLLFLDDDTPYVGKFHTAAEDPVFVLNSPLPEPYRIELRQDGTKLEIGEGQSLSEDQLIDLGGEIKGYKVSYTSPEAVNNIMNYTVLPSTKYVGKTYTLEKWNVQATPKDPTTVYQLINTHWFNGTTWKSTGATITEAAPSFTTLTNIETKTYQAVWALQQKDINYALTAGYKGTFNLWYPENVSFTVNEQSGGGLKTLTDVGLKFSDDDKNNTIIPGTIPQSEGSFTVKMNLTSESGPAVQEATINVTTTSDKLDINSDDIIVTFKGGDFGYDGTKKTDLANLVEVKGKKSGNIYAYNTHYTLEFYQENFQVGSKKEFQDAGTYKIKVVANPSSTALKGYKELSETIDIKKATLNVTAVSDVEWTISSGGNPDYSSAEFTLETIYRVGDVKDDVSINTASLTGDVSESSYRTTPGIYNVSYSVLELTGDRSENYELNPATASGNLIVKKKGTDEKPITPGDPEDGNTEIKIGDDNWEWDTDGYTRVYDGTTSSLQKDNLIYVKQKKDDNTYEWKAVPASAITVNSVTPNYPIKNVDTYTVKLSIAETEGILYSGIVGDITLVITARPITVTLGGLNAEHIGKDNLKANDFVTDWGRIVEVEKGKISGTISVAAKAIDGKYEVTFSKLALEDNTEGKFLKKNYTATFQYENNLIGNDGNGDGSIDIPIDTDYEGDGDEDGDGEIKLFRIYTDEVCAGVELEYSREVVKGGQSTIVTVNVGKGYDASALKLSYKEGMYGDWKPLTLNKDGQYQIKNIWNDIYVRAEGVVTGMEDIDGTARVYAKDGSLYIYTPQQDDIAVISMTGSVVKRTKQVGLQSYPLNQGIYVVRVGEQVFKVRVK